MYSLTSRGCIFTKVGCINGVNTSIVVHVSHKNSAFDNVVKGCTGLCKNSAYVFHDLYRARNLTAILESLRDRDILSIGRYGAWEYSAMQDAIEWGFDTAREVLK